jgi:hypothetical protein
MLTSMGIFRHPQSEESSIKEIRISKKGLWFIIMIGNEISRRKSHGDVETDDEAENSGTFLIPAMLNNLQRILGGHAKRF